MKDWDVSRRDVLKALGLGAGCLPLLSASKLWSQTGEEPRRLLIVASTEGYRQEFWRPQDGSLLTQTLPDSSSSFERHKADVIFLPGMRHPSFTGKQHGAFPNHLTAGPNSGQGEYRVAYSPSVDQIVGQPLAERHNLTRASLNLGILSSQGIMGEGSNSRYCFFRGRDQAIIPEQDPFKTYGEMFTDGGAADDAEVRRLLAQQRSILDYVGTDLERFSMRLGTEDRAVIGGHLQALRDLERQLQATGLDPTACTPYAGMPADAEDPFNFPQVLDVTFELMVMALKCDVTRVAAMQMVDSGGANLPWNFLPEIPEQGTGFHTSKRNWHDIAHNPVMDGVDHKRIVDKWCMDRFADLLDRMKAIQEPNGTLLSNSVVLITNHMEDGANHDVQKLPWILAGQCGGVFRTGQCAASAGKPINGVLADVCNAMRVPVDYYADPEFGEPWDGLTV